MEKTQRRVFPFYLDPSSDEMWFLYSVGEKDKLRERFAKWIKTEGEWSIDKAHRYRTYSEYLEENENLIKALEKILDFENEPIEGDSYWAKKLKEARLKLKE